MFQNNLQVIRIQQAAAMMGITKTSLYEQAKKGLFPPPVKLGARAVGYLYHEVETVIAARAAGQSDEELVATITKVVNARQSIAKNLLGRFAAEPAST